MEQPPLIHVLPSARNATGSDWNPSTSAQTSAKKSPAPSAAEAEKRQKPPIGNSPGKLKLTDSLPARSGSGTGRASGTFRDQSREMEFNLPDEPRTFTLILGKCPDCGCSPNLHRDVGASPEGRLYRIRTRYRVECSNPQCDEHTGWEPSSDKAMRAWRLWEALAKS